MTWKQTINALVTVAFCLAFYAIGWMRGSKDQARIDDAYYAGKGCKR